MLDSAKVLKKSFAGVSLKDIENWFTNCGYCTSPEQQTDIIHMLSKAITLLKRRDFSHKWILLAPVTLEITPKNDLSSSFNYSEEFSYKRK